MLPVIMSSVVEFPAASPANILLIKGHSSGVGDLLRSSAAWRVLHDRFPGTRLHLWFLGTRLGAVSEVLIRPHHLLSSFRVSNKRARGWGGWRELLRVGREIAKQERPDLVLDFEPNGVRTSLLAWWVGRLSRSPTVGIRQQPLRGIFYTRSAPSMRAYARRRGLQLPMDYAERDFVVLTALGLERREAPIELAETDEGRRFREILRAETGPGPLLGLNIGCGTPDAVPKRPALTLLADLVAKLQERHRMTLVLTGAPYEGEINRQFLAILQESGPVHDLAGRTTLLELSGAIKACSLFISSDSGPYHMSVALRVPTLAIFVVPNAQHYHRNPWSRCVVAASHQSLPELLVAAEELLAGAATSGAA